MVKGLFQEVKAQTHYMDSRCWEIMVELIAYWVVRHQDLEHMTVKVMKPFHGLTDRHLDLYKKVNKTGFLENYYTAAKEQPWDYIGDLYQELELTGEGENMTPKNVVDMMIEMNYAEPPDKPLITQLDPCTGTGRFLFEASQLKPDLPLVLFGIEINPALYRACLVNMAMFTTHPVSIICADTLRLDPDKTGVTSPIWDLGNRWKPPDVSEYYFKPQSSFQRYMKK